MYRERASAKAPLRAPPGGQSISEASPIGFLPRPELRNLLLKALQRRLVLIVAPTGYGKSVAVRDAVACLGMPAAWYSVGTDDHPLQSIVSSLVGVIAPSAASIEPLSTLTESEGEAADTIIRIAETARLPGVRIVVDGLERASRPGELCRLIQRILDEGPDSLGIAITSTAMPGVQSQRLAQNRQLAVIGPDRLAYTPDEVSRIIDDAWGAPAAHEFADEVYRRTEGWPRGVAVLLAAFSSSPESVDAMSQTVDALACHPSAGCIFDGIEHTDRELLLALSFLPTIEPGDGDTMVGVKGVHARLSALSRTSLLDRVGEDRYVIAAPARDWLTTLARAEWGAGRVAEHLSAVGRLLELRGNHESSLRAYVDARNGEGAARLLRTIGLGKVLQGDPSAVLPLADSLAHCERLGLEGHLLLAHLALLVGDIEGWRTHCVSLEDSLPMISLVRVEAPREDGVHLDELSRQAIQVLRHAMPEMPSIPLMWEAWLLLRRGRLDETESRARAVLASAKDETTGFLRGWALVALARVHCLRGAYSGAREALGRAEASRSGEKTFLDLLRYHGLADLDAREGALDAAIAHAERAREIAEALRVHGILRELLPTMAKVAVWRGELDEARQRVAQAEQAGSCPEDRTEMHAWIAWGAGVQHEAVRVLDRSVADTAGDLGPWALLLKGHLVAAEGDLARGSSILGSVREDAARNRWAHVEANALLCQSFWALSQGDEHQARHLLRDFWESVAVHGFRFMPVSEPELVLWAGRTASSWWPEWRIPFERLIAPAVVTEPRSLSDGAASAFAVVDTMGPLQVQVAGTTRGEEWKSNRKAKRFFELLLSCHGLSVSMDEAADVLWPDADPDKIAHRLHNEVSNLRKVLSAMGIHGHLDLRREHGSYRLYCSEQVRVTHLAFEALAKQGLEEAAAGRHDVAFTRLREAASLYLGPFLEDVRYEGFADALRTRLSDLMSRSLRTLAESPAMAEEEALTWWQRALDHDPCDEDAYRGIIELCARTGRVVQARRYLEALRKNVVEALAVSMPDWALELAETLSRE